MTQEDRYQVSCDAEGVTARRPDGETVRMRWTEVQAVRLYTTGGGAHLPPGFWALCGAGHSRLAVPVGAAGEEALLEALAERYPGFAAPPLLYARGGPEAVYVLWPVADHHARTPPVSA